MRHLELAALRIEDALRILALCVDEAADDPRLEHVRHAQGVLVHALDRLSFVRRPDAWIERRDDT